jgi:hypothetical protein
MMRSEWRIGRRRRTERKNANGSFLFGNTSFNEVALKFREICLQQRSISVDVLAASTELGESFINHRGAPEIVQER